MNSITAVIVEDSKTGRDNLIGKLKKNCSYVEIVGIAESGEKAIEVISREKPQLIFLDINLGTINGFDVLDRLRHIEFETIFTTSYTKYATDAFKVRAVHYLTKPFKDIDLIDAVNRAWEKIQVKKNVSPQRIAFTIDSKETRFLKLDEIKYCKADDNYSEIYLASKKEEKYIISQSLGNIEQKLTDSRFYRIHRSYIVNLDYVKSFLKEDGGFALLYDGTELPVSKPRQKGFKAAIAK